MHGSLTQCAPNVHRHQSQPQRQACPKSSEDVYMGAAGLLPWLPWLPWVRRRAPFPVARSRADIVVPCGRTPLGFLPALPAISSLAFMLCWGEEAGMAVKANRLPVLVDFGVPSLFRFCFLCGLFYRGFHLGLDPLSRT